MSRSRKRREFAWLGFSFNLLSICMFAAFAYVYSHMGRDFELMFNGFKLMAIVAIGIPSAIVGLMFTIFAIDDRT